MKFFLLYNNEPFSFQLRCFEIADIAPTPTAAALTPTPATAPTPNPATAPTTDAASTPTPADATPTSTTDGASTPTPAAGLTPTTDAGLMAFDGMLLLQGLALGAALGSLVVFLLMKKQFFVF